MSVSLQSSHFTNARATNFYYAFVFLPPEKRRAIEAVYAFARRGDDLADNGLSAADAAEGLARYRQSLAACYAEDLSHLKMPELRALAESIQRFHIPRQPFEDLILGLEMDLTNALQHLRRAVSVLLPRGLHHRPDLHRDLRLS
jgi:phytoene synthase